MVAKIGKNKDIWKYFIDEIDNLLGVLEVARLRLQPRVVGRVVASQHNVLKLLNTNVIVIIIITIFSIIIIIAMYKYISHPFVLLLDVLQQIFQCPVRKGTIVVAPVFGTRLGGVRRTRHVGAAHWEVAVGVGADLVAQVEMDVRKVEDLGSGRLSLNKNINNEKGKRKTLK